jgi:copper(I)-binding protein
MKTRFIFWVCLSVLAVLASPVFAKSKTGDIHIIKPWARPSPPGAGNGAAYMTLMNRGKTTDRLIRVSSPVAKKVELHTHIKSGDIMRMRRVKAVSIHKGMTQTFKSGGFHIMLMGLKKSLKNGQKFPLTLTFERAGVIKVNVAVYRLGGKFPGFLLSRPHKSHKQKKSPLHQNH